MSDVTLHPDIFIHTCDTTYRILQNFDVPITPLANNDLIFLQPKPLFAENCGPCGYNIPSPGTAGIAVACIFASLFRRKR